MKSFADSKIELIDLLPQGIDLCLQALKSHLPKGTDKSKDLVLLEARYREINQQLLQGVISGEDATLEFNKVRKSLLDFIESLSESDLQTTSATAGTPDVYNGELLYRIPNRMQVLHEAKCLVRVAFDKKILLQDLDTDKADVVKDIRISDVMGVELLDPNAERAFEIRGLSEMVQFVEKDLYTEWVFYVRALHEGTFPLVLKVSVIEIKDGVERRRNVVLEERVEIVSYELTDPEPEKKMELAGYALNYAIQQRSSTDGKLPSPTTIIPRGPTAPGWKFRKIATTMSALALLLVAVWALSTYLFKPNLNLPSASDEAWQNTVTKNTRSDYEEYVKNYPESANVPIAIQKLDSIEVAAWEHASGSGDTARIRKYIEVYPSGKFVQDALQKLDISRLDTARISVPDSVKAPAGTQTKPVAPSGKTPTTKPAAKPKPKTPAPKPTQTPATKPPQTTSPPPATDSPSQPASDTPVPVKSAVRAPVYKGCDRSDPAREWSCSERKIISFVESRLVYPAEALGAKVSGTVQVEFVIEKDGRVQQVRALNDIGGGCAAEAVRLVRSLPKFKPGLDKNGNPIRVKYLLPVAFKLN